MTNIRLQRAFVIRQIEAPLMGNEASIHGRRHRQARCVDEAHIAAIDPAARVPQAGPFSPGATGLDLNDLVFLQGLQIAVDTFKLGVTNAIAWRNMNVSTHDVVEVLYTQPARRYDEATLFRTVIKSHTQIRAPGHLEML